MTNFLKSVAYQRRAVFVAPYVGHVTYVQSGCRLGEPFFFTEKYHLATWKPRPALNRIRLYDVDMCLESFWNREKGDHDLNYSARLGRSERRIFQRSRASRRKPCTFCRSPPERQPDEQRIHEPEHLSAFRELPDFRRHAPGEISKHVA